MWNEAVEVIEATEAVEAVEAIKATDIPRPGKSLLSTPESSRLLNLALFWCFEKHYFLWNHEISFINFWTFSVRGCWGQPMILFWKLIDETQISKPPEPTKHYNAIKLWILLPLRADLLCTLQCEIPCTKVRSLSLSILLFVFFDWYLCILLLLALYHDNTFAVHSPKHLYPSYYLFVFSNSGP